VKRICEIIFYLSLRWLLKVWKNSIQI